MSELMCLILMLDHALSDALASGAIDKFTEKDLEALLTALSRLEDHRDTIADKLELDEIARALI